MMKPAKSKGVIDMSQLTRQHDGRKAIVCVDSYHNGVLRGRLYHTTPEPEHFESLSQFLIKMEQVLDMPPVPSEALPEAHMVLPLHRGMEATFQIQILFRHNTSWQGVLVWLEEHVHQRFRSTLSLILLLDSTLSQVRKEDAV